MRGVPVDPLIEGFELLLVPLGAHILIVISFEQLHTIPLLTAAEIEIAIEKEIEKDRAYNR